MSHRRKSFIDEFRDSAVQDACRAHIENGCDERIAFEEEKGDGWPCSYKGRTPSHTGQSMPSGRQDSRMFSWEMSGWVHRQEPGVEGLPGN